MTDTILDTLLLEKNGILIRKVTADNYTITFTLEHQMDVNPFINVHLIKLIHDSNTDLFDFFHTETINASEQNFYLLFKDLFANVGIPQYYYNFTMTQIKDSDKSISFLLTPIHDIYNNLALAAPLNQIEMSCSVAERTVCHFKVDVQINNSNLLVSSFLEKMVAMLLYKLINRLKQFISTII